MKGYLIHRVVPANAGDHMEYVCLVENSRGGGVWEIKRRYSVFADLRDNLDDLFDLPHCHYCKDVATKLRAIPFPQKKFFHTDDIIQQRSVQLQAYTEALLKLAANTFHRNCTLVANHAYTLLQRFLTRGQVRHLNITSKDGREGSIPCLLRELQLAMPETKKGHAKRCALEPILEIAPPIAC
ncbi:hypothetical protein ACHHYP_15003 [Achlya hypogyna]|uniref:PX domain-containing protein n=1 Tax=Achlya hypogyna TaxID=1202772 RepID=A0A1V9YBV3_ACHHY|nr:hypothetical protein ACHHYP_15003 [Achlya hypogyna]